MLAGSPTPSHVVPESIASSYGDTFCVALKEPVASDNDGNDTMDEGNVINGEDADNEAESVSIDGMEINLDEIQKAIDQETMQNSISLRTRFMMFCVLMLCYFHCGAQSGLYLVIPYYVASTPEHGWTVSDLSIIFGVFNIGGIVAAQICMLSGCAKTEKNRDRILMIGHCSQFAMGIVGSMIMSGILGFNMGAFFVGAFFGGFSTDCTIIESYGTLISDSDEVQSRLLGSIGKVFLIAGIVNSFLLPAIYQHFGFGPFCGALCALEGLALLTLFILWIMIHQNTPNDNDENDEKQQKRSIDEDSRQSNSPSLSLLAHDGDAGADTGSPLTEIAIGTIAAFPPKMDTIDSS